MSPDESWLLDMLNYARTARERVEGVTLDHFLADVDKQFALTHLIMIIGEAAAQVSEQGRALLPSLPWGKIVGTRNRIVHHYFKVDLEILWSIAEHDLPELIAVLEPVIASYGPAGKSSTRP